MLYSENLGKSRNAFGLIPVQCLCDKRIRELSPWIKEMSHLRKLVISGCTKLVSLRQLPGSLLGAEPELVGHMPHLLLLWIRPCSLRYLKAENCESLERLDSSSYFKDVGANFGNCFKLNQEVIRTCRLRPYLVKKCPYKACVLVVNNKGDAEVCDRKEELDGYYCIKD
ncbi:unnamed protein product, partial [Brassica rapa subsp. narinosa]